MDGASVSLLFPSVSLNLFLSLTWLRMQQYFMLAQ